MSDAWQQHFRSGLGLLDGEKFAEAIVELSRALVEAPDEHVAQCYATRGYAQLCHGEYQLAIDDCNLAIEHDKTDGEAFAWRGSAHAGLSQWRETIDDYLVAIRLCPEKAEEYRDILLAHLDEAIRDFTSRINSGASGETFRDRGSAYAFRGEHQAAVKDFTKAIEHQRRDGVAYARRGESLLALAQYEQAADDCTRGMRCGVDDAAIYFTRAKALRQLGQTDKAVADLTRAIRHEPRFAAAFCERGLAQVARKAIDAAIGDFSRAIALDTKLDEPLLERAKLQAERGQFAQAINDYTAALKLRPNHVPYLLARAQTYLDMQLPQEALRDFDAVLAIDAVNRAAYRGRGLALHQQGDADGAIREFTKAIRLDARYAAAYESRGDVYLEREENEKASADFSKAIDLAGANSTASLYSRRGVARLDANNYEGAAQDFTLAIERDAHDADSHAWRAAAYGELNRCGNALDDVARAIELAPQRAVEYRQIGQHASQRAIPALTLEIKSHPKDARLFRERAMAYEFQESANEALADYNTAIQLAPEERDNYFRRGSILWRAGKFERALVDFSKAIALGDERAVCFHHRGVSLARLGKTKQALEDLQRAVELNPLDGKFYRDRAEIYAAIGQLDLAEADFSQAIGINPGDGRAFFGRGYVHHLRRNYEQAIRDFSAAIGHDRQHAMSYFRRGESQASLGKFAPAINDFDAAIQLDPQMIAAYCSRGLTIAKAGRHARAVLELTKAGGRIRYDVRFAQAFDCRARIYYSMGHYARALADFERVLELQPEQNLAQTHYGRGLALAQLEKWDEAAASFEQALSIDATHRDARGALDWLRGDRQVPLAALKRPAKVAALPQPLVVIPPVRLENGVDAYRVEALWDQWLIQADDNREYGPVTKTELDTWVIQGRLAAKAMLQRMDWDDWQPATDVYRELALATHRTANRPMLVPPPPTLSQTLEQKFDTAEEPGGEEAAPQPVFNIKL